MNTKMITTVFLSAMLLACGGGGSSSSDSEPQAASLKDLTGTWDLTSGKGSDEDVYFLLIDNDGSFDIYDYQGDAFDDGDDCYDLSQNTIVSQGDGNFEIINQIGVSEGVVKVTKNNDKLFLESNDESTVIKTSAYRSNKSKSDLTPLCS